jgi:hypothetical protein
LCGLTQDVSKSLKTLNNLDAKEKIGWEVLKAQLTLISHIYTFGNTTKKCESMISYNQQHGTTPMKKHISTKHLATW